MKYLYSLEFNSTPHQSNRFARVAYGVFTGIVVGVLIVVGLSVASLIFTHYDPLKNYAWLWEMPWLRRIIVCAASCFAGWREMSRPGPTDTLCIRIAPRKLHLYFPVKRIKGGGYSTLSIALEEVLGLRIVSLADALSNVESPNQRMDSGVYEYVLLADYTDHQTNNPGVELQLANRRRVIFEANDPQNLIDIIRGLYPQIPFDTSERSAPSAVSGTIPENGTMADTDDLDAPPEAPAPGAHSPPLGAEGNPPIWKYIYGNPLGKTQEKVSWSILIGLCVSAAIAGNSGSISLHGPTWEGFFVISPFACLLISIPFFASTGIRQKTFGYLAVSRNEIRIDQTLFFREDIVRIRKTSLKSLSYWRMSLWGRCYARVAAERAGEALEISMKDQKPVLIAIHKIDELEACLRRWGIMADAQP